MPLRRKVSRRADAAELPAQPPGAAWLGAAAARRRPRRLAGRSRLGLGGSWLGSC
jgi:hypothetical protein